MGVHCVRRSGNDGTARKLTPLIRAARRIQHKRATVGLDILAAIGSDIALMQQRHRPETEIQSITGAGKEK
ncbi:hypothetical protein DMI62_14765 [Escherichia coli]|nr:hypothetical protein [Escherichia coli]